MRPSEVDHTSTKTPYFDTINGEVITGKRALNGYLKEGANPENVQLLGNLLLSESVLDQDSYDPFDYSEWTPDQFKSYGRWIGRAVLEAETSEDSDNHQSITYDVLNRARMLGVGPGPRVIQRVFSTLGSFYCEIGAKESHRIGVFDEWTLDDFISYAKDIGSELGRRPKNADFDERAKANPKKPNAQLIFKKTKDIGGVMKVVELAGYPVVEFWQDDDFINWGVKFMQANDGWIPTARAINMLSKKQLGPSEDPIKKRFDSVRNFQHIIEDEYKTAKQEDES